MRGPLITSILLHIALVLAILVPWPGRDRDLIELGSEQVFEVVQDLPDSPEPPAPEPPPEPEPEPPPPAPAPEPPPPPEPEPPPPAPAPEPPPPEPEPAPEPEPPPPEPEPVPEPEPPPPEPEPEPEPEPPPPEPEPEPEQAAAPPPAFIPPDKPEPPEPPERQQDFASSVLNTLAETEDRPPPPPEPEEDVTTLNDAVAAALGNRAEQASQTTRVSSPGLTDSELTRVRDQIVRCWNPPVGAANVQDMLAVVEIQMNRDKTVASAVVTELSSSATQQFGESVVRAVLRCSPLELPDGKYDQWNLVILTFSPRDMVF